MDRFLGQFHYKQSGLLSAVAIVVLWLEGDKPECDVKLRQESISVGRLQSATMVVPINTQ